jgi:hypothetical protein
VTRRVIAIVVAVAVLLGVGVGVWRHKRSKAAREADVAAASLQRCLLGPPLAEGETAGARLHRIALGNPPTDWPSRCNPLASELADALDAAGRGSDGAEVCAKWGKGFDLDAMEQTPWSITLPAVPQGAEPSDKGPGAPAAPEVADERLAALSAHGSLAKTSSDAMPGRALNVLLGPDVLCSFSKGLDQAACSGISSRAPQGAQSFELWPPTDDGAPVWVTDFVTPGGKVQRFFRADNGKLVDTQSPERAVYAYGYGDGRVLTLGPAGEERDGFDLTLWKGKEHEKPMSLDFESRSLALYGDRMLWTRRADDDLDHLYSAKIGTDPLDLGKAEDHGALEVVPNAFDACRTKNALAVVLLRGADARVMFFSDAGASQLMQAKLRADASVVHRAFACGEDDVSITRVVTRTRTRSTTDSIGYIVQYARCTESGCSTEEVDVDKMLEGVTDGVRPSGTKNTEVVAAGLGGKLLVVWRSRSRGVRVRLATPKELGQAKDSIVYDDGIQDGLAAKVSSVFRMSLYPRYDAAVLLLERVANRGVVGMRVAKDGGVSPVAVRE